MHQRSDIRIDRHERRKLPLNSGKQPGQRTAQRLNVDAHGIHDGHHRAIAPKRRVQQAFGRAQQLPPGIERRHRKLERVGRIKHQVQPDHPAFSQGVRHTALADLYLHAPQPRMHQLTRPVFLQRLKQVVPLFKTVATDNKSRQRVNLRLLAQRLEVRLVALWIFMQLPLATYRDDGFFNEKTDATERRWQQAVTPCTHDPAPAPRVR